MEKITASSVVGDIRKAARMYEVFKAAEDMVSVLVNLEQTERQLQKDIVTAKEELAKVEKITEASQETAQKNKEGAKAEADKLRSEAASLKEQASEAMRKARSEAADIVAKAKKEAEGIKASIEDLKKTEGALKIVLANLEHAKAEMLADMQAKRDQLLKAFS